MEDVLQRRLERIQAFTDRGFTADLETGIVYSPVRWDRTGKVKERGSVSITTGYVKLITRVDGNAVYLLAHQFIYFLGTGKVVPELDHIDRDKTNNKFENLREVTRSENRMNAEFKGYHYVPKIKKYRAQIRVNKSFILLGYFETPEEAHKAYVEAKEKYHIIGDSEQVLENVKNRQKTYTKKRKFGKGYVYIKDENYKNRWRACVKINKKPIYLGHFETEEEARAAYLEALVKYNLL